MIVAVGAILMLPAVQIEGSTGCPSPEQVSTTLTPLLPEAEAGRSPDRVQLDAAEGRLRVVLRRPDGALLAERELVARGSCTELATAVSVIVAAWETELRLSVEAPRSITPAPALMEQPAAAKDARWEVGGWVGKLLVRSDWTPSVGIDGVLFPHGGRTGLRLALAGEGFHESGLGDGSVGWTRLAAAAGPRGRFSIVRQLRMDLQASVLGALVLARGHGYPVDHTRAGGDVGVGAGMRLVLFQGRLRPWAGVDAYGWPWAQQMTVVPQSPYDPMYHTKQVPSWEATLSLGFVFGGGR